MELSYSDILKLIQVAKLHHKEFKQFCCELFKKNIDLYVYCYINKEGKMVILSTDPSLVEKYLLTHQYIHTPYLNNLGKLPHFILYSDLYKFNKTDITPIHLLQNQMPFNRSGAATIISDSEYLLYINYAGSVLTDSCIASLSSAIEKFSYVITQEFHDIIETGLNQNVLLPNYKKIISSLPKRPYFSQHYQPNVSSREYSCLKLLMEGSSYAQIAHKLSISERTVANHLQNIKLKNNINSPRKLAEVYYHLKSTLMLGV